MNRTKVEREMLEKAREEYALPSSDSIEIDDNAEVHRSGDGGYWVQAWVYVRNDD